MPPHQTFPKSEHLRYGIQFRRVYDNGQKFVGRLVVVYVLRPDPDLTSSTHPSATALTRGVGVVTSRRVGGAVTRNRARRLMREAYRRHRTALPSDLQMVIVARVAIAGKKLADVEGELVRIWHGARLLD